MPNYNYNKGVRKERKIVNEARDNDLIAFRSAGSHSCIDVVIINIKQKQIQLIQCKPDNISTKSKIDLENKHHNLNDIYKCEFIVL